MDGLTGPQTARAIVALDVPSLDAARALVERLGDSCDFYKVGLELFAAEGPAAVRWLRENGREVFLDLKLHDIPNTVRGAAMRAADLGASLLTVHAGGGPTMVEAAVAGAGKCGVLGVTVLTSLDDAGLSAALGRPAIVANEVIRLADVAAMAGAHGVVCSGAEARWVRERQPRLHTLVPGVRLSGDAVGDQARVVTPRDAARAGASYVILGRTVTAAPDPAAALMAAQRELLVSQPFFSR